MTAPPARKDIATDGGGTGALAPSPLQALEFSRAQRDRVMQIEPARLQQSVDGLEIGRVVGEADLFEHADRGDLVEAALDQRIVAQLERHLVLQTSLGNFLLRIGELLLRQRHAMGAYAVVPGGMTDERPPP